MVKNNLQNKKDLKMKTRFFQISDSEFYGKVDDFVVGYDNDVTYRFPKELAEKIWNGHTKEIAQDLEDDEKIEEIEEEFGIDIDDYEMRGVQYHLSDENEPCYYWQKGMLEAQLCQNESEFFETYPDESILLGDDRNGYSQYEPEWVGNMSTAFELEFAEKGDCIEEICEVCLKWEEFYTDEDGETIQAIVENSNRQESKDYYSL